MPADSDKAKESAAAKTESATTSSDAGGSNVWELEKHRRVKVGEQSGRNRVDIREYYEEKGAILPGKMGIALTSVQWKKLLEYAPEITKAMES